MPYTGVKTSILIFDRAQAKRNPSILFSEVKHIGVSLGAKRTATELNDLPTILNDYQAYYQGGEFSQNSWFASRDEVAANDFILTGGRYRSETSSEAQNFVRIGDVCAITKGRFSSTKTPPGPYPPVLTAADAKTSAEYQLEGPAVCVPLISSLGHGKAALHRIHYVDGKFALASLLVALTPRDKKQLDARFLYYVLDSRRKDIAGLMRGAANVGMKPEDLEQFQIPLPSLEKQQEIVTEIEGYQKVIHGARAVLENYRASVQLDPSWQLKRIDEICTLNPSRRELGEIQSDLQVSFVPMSDLNENEMAFIPVSRRSIQDVIKDYTYFRDGDVLLAKVTPCFENGKAGVAQGLSNSIGFGSSEFFVLRGNGDVLPEWIYLFVTSDAFRIDATEQMTGTGGLRRVPRSVLEELLVPFPPLEVQRSIVAEINTEQSLVSCNRELIARFEDKIQTTLAKIWSSRLTS